MTKRHREITSHKDVLDWVKLARNMDPPWEVKRTRNGHLQWKAPLAEQFVVTASDPNPAGMRKDRQKLVDYGLPIPGMALPGPQRAPLSESEKINKAGYLTDLIPGEDDTTCPCGKEFAVVEAAVLHRIQCPDAAHLYEPPTEEDDAIMERSLTSPPERERLNCPECPKWFWISQPAQHALHLRVDHGKAQCPLCLKVLRYDYLKTHLSEKCPKRPTPIEMEPLTGDASKTVPMDGEEQVMVEMPGNIRVVLTKTQRELERLAEEEAAREAAASELEKSVGPGVGSPDPGVEVQPTIRPTADDGRWPPSMPDSAVVAPRAPATSGPLSGTPDAPAPPLVPSTAPTDDELWDLMELILDRPVMLTRETDRIVRDWQRATRRLLALREA